MHVNKINPYVIAILFAIAANTNADTKLVLEEIIVLGVAGSDEAAPETRTEFTLWMRDDRTARVSPGTRMVARLDRGEMYIINDTNKTVHTIKLRNKPNENRLAITKSTENREVNGWQATRYNLTFEVEPDTKINMALWISDDIGVDLQAYRTFSRSMDTGDGLLNAIVELPGYPVLQETDMTIARSQLKLLAATEEAAPAGTYDVPQDYQRK